VCRLIRLVRMHDVWWIAFALRFLDTLRTGAFFIEHSLLIDILAYDNNNNDATPLTNIILGHLLSDFLAKLKSTGMSVSS
jgi:hypothetical protein